jgi:serralysin
LPERSPQRLVALLATAALATAVAATIQVPAQAAAPTVPAKASNAASAATGSVPFERWATLSKTSVGYYYDAGQQDTHLVMTRVAGGVLFADTHTDVLRAKANACRKLPAHVGIVVLCRVPATVDARHPMTLKVFTRLGDDNIDGSTLSAAFRMYILADAGNDVVRAGAGNDFVNGALGSDWVSGGDGNDWIRTGPGNDHIWGGKGNDRLVGVDGRDSVYGGRGNDRVGGGAENDVLFAGAGTDFVLCGAGQDAAHAGRADRIMGDCELVDFS